LSRFSRSTICLGDLELDGLEAPQLRLEAGHRQHRHARGLQLEPHQLERALLQRDAVDDDLLLRVQRQQLVVEVGDLGDEPRDHEVSSLDAREVAVDGRVAQVA
jgi:hypothetical protein